ncbi:MAG: Uma2 family endonuclease, partial [Chromatiaceae bacterium]
MNPSTSPRPDRIDAYPEDFWPDVDDLVTEDDTPVDNIFSEKQQRLLTEPLYSSGHSNPEDSNTGHSNGLTRPFAAMANVGLFYQTHHPPLVPDMLLSLGVEIPADVWSKSHRAYFVWEFGKPPDVVIEVVSNREGHELDSKVGNYAAIGVKYYAVFDPERLLGDRLLRLHELHGASYVERTGLWMPDIGLGLCVWEGAYEGMTARWLRWCDAAGEPIASGAEAAEQERERADQERARAEQE